MDKRIYAFDNLRSMIALSVALFHIVFFLYLFHSAEQGYIAYNVNQIYFSSLPTDIYSIAFQLLTYVPFFMGIFYLLCGFFANYMCREKETIYFLKNRLVRISIPLFFYFLCMIVYYLFAYLLPDMLRSGKTFLFVLHNQYYHGDMWPFLNNTSTYWFLNVLLWFCAVTVLFCVVKKTKIISEKCFIICDTAISFLFLSWRAFFLIPLFLIMLLIKNHVWFFVLDENIIPHLPVFFFYGIWYGIGWNLYNHQDKLSHLNETAWQQVCLSILFYICHVITYMYFVKASVFWGYALSCVLFSLALVFCVPGFLGLFMRYFNRNYRFTEYLACASYWMYLMQIPVIYLIDAYAIVYIKSFYLQFLVALVAFSFVFWVSYRFLIQGTRLKWVVG